MDFDRRPIDQPERPEPDRLRPVAVSEGFRWWELALLIVGVLIIAAALVLYSDTLASP